MNNKYKIGDKVKLLTSMFGYYEGDIATIIDIKVLGYAVYVSNRN